MFCTGLNIFRRVVLAIHNPHKLLKTTNTLRFLDTQYTEVYYIPPASQYIFFLIVHPETHYDSYPLLK